MAWSIPTRLVTRPVRLEARLGELVWVVEHVTIQPIGGSAGRKAAMHDIVAGAFA
jgi:hypothetical protein